MSTVPNTGRKKIRKAILILSCIAFTSIARGQNDTLQISTGDETVLIKASDILRITFDSAHMGRPIMGLQRWDMYSGLGATQGQELGYIMREGDQGFLVPEQWHHRAPFFVRRTADVDWIEHPEDAGPLWFNWPYDFALVQETMDQEIDFATDAGIDFFIFNGPALTIQSNGWGLHNNLDAYLLNTRKDKVKFVCALYGKPSIDYGRTKVDLMLDEAISYMKLPEWQTVLTGRPLVPVLFPREMEEQLEGQDDPAERMSSAEFVQHIRNRVMAEGLRNPYIVAMPVSASFQHAAEFESDGYDAFTDYAGSYGGAMVTFGNGPSFASATNAMMDKWDESFKTQELDFVPPMSNGNYSWPRAKGDTWYIIEEHLPGDMKERVLSSLQYTVENSEDCEAQVLFSYSWNEHSEGGGICPTMGESPDYIPVTATLDEFADGLREFEETHIPGPARPVMQVNRSRGALVEFPVSDLNTITYDGYGYIKLHVYHGDTSTSRVMTEIDRIAFDNAGNLSMALQEGGYPVLFPVEDIDSICFETPGAASDPEELIQKGDFNYFEAININFSGEANEEEWRCSHQGTEPNLNDWKSMNAGGGIERAAFCKMHVATQFLASNRLSLEEGKTYRLSFKYKQHSLAEFTGGVGLDVYLGTTQDKAGVSDTLSTIRQFSMLDWDIETMDFQVTLGGDYYLVFGTLAPMDSADIKIYVDDVSVIQLLALNKVHLETTLAAVQRTVDAQSDNIGYEAGEYTQQVMDMVEAAIAEAQEVLDYATQQEQLDEAIADLEQAMREFTSNLLSTTELRALIDSSCAVVEAQSGNIGEEEGQYTQAVVDAAGAAISAAEDVRDTATVQSSVDTAVTALRTAMSGFVPNAAVLDVSVLQSAINAAQAMVDTARVGSAVGEYSQEVMDMAISAIAAAQTVLDTATIQSVIDAAVIELETEMAKFVPNATGLDQKDMPVVSLFPNPVADELFIRGEDPVYYWITDLRGRVLAEGGLTGRTVDVSFLENGLYFIQFRMMDNELLSLKFLKQED